MGGINSGKRVILNQDHDEMNSNKSNQSPSSAVGSDIRKVLSILSNDEVTELLDILADLPVEVVGEPETGLIMARARDCFDEDFNLGEILVTTAEAASNGVRAHATIMGGDLRKAVLVAAVDALLGSNHQKALEAFTSVLESPMQRFYEKREEELRLVAGTRVTFDSMAKED
jgi:phosphonate C-P lyase system protein PhnG